MNTTEIGGHRCVDTGRKFGISGSNQPVTLWRCLNCGLENSWHSFDSGIRGCPMRPESLDYLSVCPGGERCEGHMDTSTEDYRVWKASTSMPSDLVPRFRCDAALLGMRAARQWLKHADKIGLKTSVWAQEGIAKHVGAGGGRIAQLNTTAGHYHIVVTRHGNLRAHRDPEHGCRDCAELINTGDVTA